MNYMHAVTGLQLLDYRKLFDEFFYIPEQDPFSRSFENADYESKFLIVNAASLFTSFSLWTGLQLVLLLLFGSYSCYSERADWVRKRIQDNLLWRGSIRFLMESYLELCVLSILNVQEIKWYDGLAFITFSNRTSYALLVILGIVPLLLLCIILKHRDRLKEYVFKARYGSILDGTKSEGGVYYNVSLLSPLIFFARRLIMGLSLVHYHGLFVSQVIIQTCSTLGIMVSFSVTKPLKSIGMHKLAMFNEAASLLILYTLLCFTDWIADHELSHQIGFVYIATVILLCLVHVLVLIITVIMKLREKARLHWLRKVKQQRDAQKK